MNHNIGNPYTNPLQQRPGTGNVNAVNLQRSQNEVYNALRATESTFTQQLGQFQKVLSRSIALTKKELTQEIEKERGFIKKLNSYDTTQILQLKKRMEEIKRKNNQTLRKVLNFQELIVSIATHQGMLDLNAVSIERESEIYRNANQIQRLEVEMERQVFDLQSQISVENPDLKEQKYDTTILKGFEQALSAVAMQVLDCKTELNRQYNIMSRNERKNRGDRSNLIHSQYTRY